MTSLKRLTDEGIQIFLQWLETSSEPLPPELKDEPYCTDSGYAICIDPSLTFATRYEFGVYLAGVLASVDFHELLSAKNDGLWDWIALLYLPQLAPNGPNRSEYYVVKRKGPRGSLAYRQAARTSYELVKIHAETARVCLNVPMDTWGEMAEQLSARQTVAHHRGFFEAAHRLYYENGKIKKGAASRPKKPSERKPKDRVGFGGVRRLAVALTRLDLTYDTEVMKAAELVTVLPREFKRWTTA
jgi:hypothetical protein